MPPTDRRYTENTWNDVSRRGLWVVFSSYNEDGPSHLFLRGMRGRTLTKVDRPRVAPGPRTRLNRYMDGFLPAGISGDGRYVVFHSGSSALVRGDDNRKLDIFLYDRVRRKVKIVSVTRGGKPANGHSIGPSISQNGRYVAFTSTASNLTADTHAPGQHVYVRDLEEGVTQIVSVGYEGVSRPGSHSPVVSNDGTRVAFLSRSERLVPADDNRAVDAFVRDLVEDETIRVSVDSEGEQLEPFVYSESASTFRDGVDEVTLSGNGRVAVFTSHANGLVDEDQNNNVDVFAHDLVTRETTRVSVSSSGGDGYRPRDRSCGENGQCFGFIRSHSPSVSSDGQRVAFLSGAPVLVENDRDARYGSDEDVFVHDRVSKVTVLINRRYTGVPNTENNFSPGSISANGRWVTYSSDGKLISGPNDRSVPSDVYLQRLPAFPT